MILLLVLSLILTGCEAGRDIEACPGGWFKFTCKYSHQKVPECTREDKQQNNISMYNTSVNPLRVIAKNLTVDSGNYKCRCQNPLSSKSKISEKKLEVKVKNDSCETQLFQTAYATAKTTITCNYDKKDGKSYFCKDNGFDCTDIFSKRSPGTSDGRFTLTKIGRVFNVSINDVSSQDSGVYWCAVKSDGYHRSIRRIQLEVQNITSDTRSATVGETLTYNCSVSNTFIKKFVCKGEDPSLCKQLVSSDNPVHERFSLKVDKLKINIKITMTDLRTDDSGTYWCGAKSVEKTRSDLFTHRLVMTVEPRLATIPPVHETTRSLTSDKPQDGSLLPVIGAIVAVICAAVLVLIVVIYRRCNSSKNTTHEGQNEDHNYAEIEERPQKPDLGTAPKTVYVTANFPTNISASHHSNVLFEKSSGEVSSDTYSTVGGSVKGPTYSTVNHPSCFTEKPFYSTVNFHVDQQQH